MLRKILQGVHTHVAKHRKAPQTVIHVAADADTNTSTPMSAWRAHPEHVAQALSQSLQTRTIVPTQVCMRHGGDQKALATSLHFQVRL